MVSIYVDDEDKTAQISDWTIYWDDHRQALQLKCIFPSKKSFTRPLSACCVVPTRELDGMLLKKRQSMLVQTIEKASIYGDRYAVVNYTANGKPYVFKLDGIEFIPQAAMKDEAVFRYLLAVANARKTRAGTADKGLIAENIVRQLESLTPCSHTALHAYCSGQNATRVAGGNLIFPFGVNESQLTAVERAFGHQVSVIEGPPGTGKTQTILNILANILLRGKTVAVLSNNNLAVENVFEKLERFDLGYLVAKLGNQENRQEFFGKLASRSLAEPEPAPSMEEIQTTLARVKQLLRDHNLAAQLQAEIDELDIERSYLQQWRDENAIPVAVPLDKYGLSPQKTADLMAYLAFLGTQRIGIKERIELLFNFKIFRTKPFAKEARLPVFHALQMHYYDKALREKDAALQACRESLTRGNFEALLEELTTASMRYLKHSLQSQVPLSNAFDAKTYKKDFDAFVERFPILASSTHSIVNSIAKGAILDYVIIDEASQQDIVPGVLALGCSKNVIVVGDSRQLAHIPASLGLQAPAVAYDCDRYSLLDSCSAVFEEKLPKTLLREHYRCHPRIIQFCNQQFYDNALIPMNRDSAEAPLRMLVTAKGNHARQNTNLRELDSVLAVLDQGADQVWLQEDGRGFIAPYRAQVELSDTRLPADFVKNTVHKFQGRECDEIIFSTVLDKKRRNQKRLDFVDDARMINVAVSRAKKRFTLVTGDDVFAANNGHVAALMRYVEYYAQDSEIVRAPVVSAFDLLYTEYDQSLERLHARLRSEDSRYRSEQIVAQLLREALSAASRLALSFHAQIPLNQVASPANPALTEQELKFMQNGASCDFVVYYKVGKTPVGVIEVDGGSHDKTVQARRDALKNSILEKSGLRLLRLPTVESGIEEKLDSFLAPWTRAGEEDESPMENAR